MPLSRFDGLRALFGLGITLLIPSARLFADEPPLWPCDPAPAPEATSSPRPHCIRLFGLEPAFPSDPVGLEPDDPPGSVPGSDAGPDWFQLAMGNDNPFFDLRRRGDPGGVGYLRLQTQTKIAETSSTLLSAGLRAVTPAGPEDNGLAEGPTVLSPGFSLFHAFTNGTAIQGYVGKNFTVGAPASYHLHRAAHCALAVQQPLGEELSGVYFFVEGLGRFRYESLTEDGPAARWDVLPGIHWKVTDAWWLSGGIGVPVSPGNSDRRFWQCTCSFQY